MCNFGFQQEALNRAFLNIFEELLVMKNFFHAKTLFVDPKALPPPCPPSSAPLSARVLVDPLHRGLLELAGGVHDDLRGAGRDRRPLVRLPVEAVAGEHPLGPECDGMPTSSSWWMASSLCIADLTRCPDHIRVPSLTLVRCHDAILGAELAGDLVCRGPRVQSAGQVALAQRALRHQAHAVVLLTRKA